jgi:hypothetical protein
VAVSFDQPLVVVELDEVGDGSAEVVEVGVEPRPQALLLERLDPPFGAAVAFGFADVGGVFEDAEPAQGALEVDRAVLIEPQSWRTARPRATSGPSVPQRSMTAS